VLTLQQWEMLKDRSDVRDAPRRGGAALEMPRQPRRESSVSAVREVRRDAVSSTTWVVQFRGLMFRSTSFGLTAVGKAHDNSKRTVNPKSSTIHITHNGSVTCVRSDRSRAVRQGHDEATSRIPAAVQGFRV
jgi:hypothetical protein